MYKALVTLPPNLLTEVENILYEIAPSNWILSLNRKTRILTLEGLFSDKDDAVCGITNFQNYYTGQTFEFLLEETNDDDWINSYKHHFETWNYKNYKFIPEWERNIVDLNHKDIPIYVDPGMAFGTGAHETTRLCIEFLIDKYGSDQKINGALLDVGCGSGILSILAEKIGFDHVLGIDNDTDAISNACLNAKLNLTESDVIFEKADLRRIPEKAFQCVIANIQSDVLISNSVKLVGMTDSCLILSGILNYEIEDVIKVFEKKINQKTKSFNCEVKSSGEWSTACFA